MAIVCRFKNTPEIQLTTLCCSGLKLCRSINIGVDPYKKCIESLQQPSIHKANFKPCRALICSYVRLSPTTRYFVYPSVSFQVPLPKHHFHDFCDTHAGPAMSFVLCFAIVHLARSSSPPPRLSLSLSTMCPPAGKHSSER